jgi:integrase
LKWDKVDFEDGYIFVTETKNDESRSIPIDENLLDTLIRLRQNSESEYVFTTDTGKPYTSKSAWRRAWDTALRKSKISHGRFHDMRHTFVSTLIVDEKEDNATVMAMSGHKDMRMLQRYSHTREEAKKSAISKLGNRLKSVHFEGGVDTYSDTSDINQETMDTNIIALTQGN